MNSTELALAIAIPVTLGVCFLVAVPFIVKYYRRRNKKKQAFKNIDVEKALWGHSQANLLPLPVPYLKAEPLSIPF